MEVKIDRSAGFCFGVVKAIDTAERELGEGRGLFCLGDIVHNSAEVDRLRNKGLTVVDHADLARLGGERVLIRAHGEPPSTYRLAEQYGIRLVDATCPMVLALQKRIRAGFCEMQQVGGQVVIFGKRGHAEVIGLSGQTDDNAVVVSAADDLEGIDFMRPIRLYSQTTKSEEEYRMLISNIERRLPAGADFKAYNTICSSVSKRVSQLREFASGVDAVIFVSGEGSSNGRYLFEHCRQVQPRTHFLSSVRELEASWVKGCGTVGVTGATSTPRWLMEQVAEALSELKVEN